MRNKLKNEHIELGKEIKTFLDGRQSAADLKHATAPFGIYQQRDDLFMARIRLTGGHLANRDILQIADIIDENNIGYAHLTTRQDIQLQGVPAENICQVVNTCTANGLPFKGGGGNTFRNIAVSPDSGISPASAFDVIPYAKSLTDIIFEWDKAFELPRKLKIGFAASQKDELIAALQDLGFVAVIKNGKRGFKVYGGGGMGRESSTGVKLFDFIPAGEVPKCALAMTELFYAHGDRENRNKARVRFIVKRLGEEKFPELFKEYYGKVNIEANDFPEWKLDLKKEISGLYEFAEEENRSSSYRRWLKYAVSSTRFENIVSVKIFVPEGNLNTAQLRNIAEIAELYGASFVRLTASQDILLPLIKRSTLPRIYNSLENELSDIDPALKSFKGHITSCVGATVCKTGILDSPAMGRAIARELDKYFKDKLAIKAGKTAEILDMIKISGCPNSCSGHPAACIGMQGQKKNIDGNPENVYKIFVKRDAGAFALAEAGDYFVKQTDVPGKVLELLKEKFKELP